MWLIAGWDPGHKKDGGDILSDLWRLDLDTYAWKKIAPQVCCLARLSVQFMDPGLLFRSSDL